MKTATTIPQQLEILKSRGLKINDENKAAEILLDIGYYRLGFYWFPFEKGYPNWRGRTHIFKDGATFEWAVTLYYFDHDLRHLLIPYLQRVEIHLRTTLIYIASNHYKKNPIWFANPSLVAKNFISKLPNIYKEIKDQNKAIQRHHKKYKKDKFAPAWKTIEYMTFGNILYLIDNLKDEKLRNEIIKQLGYTNYDVFSSHMNALRILRNKCAHGHNIFDLKLDKPINYGTLKNLTSKNRSNSSGAIRVLVSVLGNMSHARSKELVEKTNQLIMDESKSAIFDIISHLRIDL